MSQKFYDQFNASLKTWTYIVITLLLTITSLAIWKLIDIVLFFIRR